MLRKELLKAQTIEVKLLKYLHFKTLKKNKKRLPETTCCFGVEIPILFSMSNDLQGKLSIIVLQI